MNALKTSTLSNRRDDLYVFRTTRILLPILALLIFCSALYSFGQIDSARLTSRIAPGPGTVSRNQLLAPEKALKAVDRAHKDILNGHTESAQKEITKALDIAPHFAVARAILGGLFLDAGRYDDATKSFQAAMDDDPTLCAAYVGMALILIHNQRFEAALPLLERAEALFPTAWFVHFEKAWAQMQTGSLEPALQQLELAEKVAGEDAEKRSGVFYLRALVSIHKKDTDGAKQYLAQAVARDPRGQYAAMAKRELERIQPLSAAR